MATHSESLAEALPFADRPVEKAPGHWVLARAGKTVLRPGGLALSTWALKRAVLPGSDVVVGEAMLSMQGEKAKRAIMGEAARILRPGGRYVIHELAMRPDSIPEEPATEIRRALARAINVNARPLTVADWRRALEEVGLVVEETRTAPMALLKPGRMIADEGVRGALRIMRNVARDKDLRERVTTMARTFKKYDRHLCGVAIVARKPKENQ